MKKNMGNIDRAVRFLIVIAIAVLFYMEIITGVAGIVLLTIAGIFLLTSLVSFCPIYAIFGLNTCAVKKDSQ